MISHIRKITEKELNEMLTLRRKGWTYQSLAFIYGVDHSSIYHLCHKYRVQKVGPEISFNLPGVIEVSRPADIIPSILEVVIRPKPLSYADYLKLQLK